MVHHIMRMEMNPSQVLAMEPRDDLQFNNVNLGSHNPLLIAASVITLFLILSGITARTYTKAVIIKEFAFPDWVLLLTRALFIVFVSFSIHLSSMTSPSIGEALNILNIIQILYCPTMFCAKYVVLRQIELIFFNHDRKTLAFTSVRILIWVNLLFYIAAFLSFLLQCIPRAKIWDPALPGVCTNTQQHTVVVTGAINVFSDLTILITPIAVIWKLQMPFKRKIGSAAVFGVGVLANITSIIRLYYTIQLGYSDNISWSVVWLSSWVLGEFTAVILVACFPYFPRLYQHISHNYRRSRHPIPNNGTQNTPWARPSRPEPKQLSRTFNAALRPSRGKEGGVPI